MISRAWLFRTAAAFVVLFCINCAVAISIDPYGLFHNPRGRLLPIAFDPPRAKFLLSKRYVPLNFDALLIGPSLSQNWDLAALPGFKLYNESIPNSNVVDEKQIVRQALPFGDFKLAICILDPTMTSAHLLHHGLESASTLESLMSIHLYVQEAIRILPALQRFIGPITSPDGTTPLRERTSASIPAATYVPSYFTIDPIAAASYKQMIDTMQSEGLMIVYVIPPLYEPCRIANDAALTRYNQTIVPLLPQAPIIDLGQPELSSFRNDSANYIDCSHLNARGVATIDAYLTQRIPEALAAPSN